MIKDPAGCMKLVRIAIALLIQPHFLLKIGHQAKTTIPTSVSDSLSDLCFKNKIIALILEVMCKVQMFKCKRTMCVYLKCVYTGER